MPKLLSLETPIVPTMPTPGPQYDVRAASTSNGLLRTFHLKLVAMLRNLLGPNGGRYIDCPAGLFFNTAEQTFGAANTAQPVTFNTTYLSNSVALQSASTSKIEVTIGGIYNFQFSGQLLSESANAKTLWLWINRNGTDIGYSTRAYTLSANNEFFEICWSFNIDLEAGQYIELKTAVSDTNMHLHAESASSPHAGIPSAVLSVNFIAPPPATLPTPP